MPDVDGKYVLYSERVKQRLQAGKTVQARRATKLAARIAREKSRFIEYKEHLCDIGLGFAGSPDEVGGEGISDGI